MFQTAQPFRLKSSSDFRSEQVSVVLVGKEEAIKPGLTKVRSSKELSLTTFLLLQWQEHATIMSQGMEHCIARLSVAEHILFLRALPTISSIALYDIDTLLYIVLVYLSPLGDFFQSCNA